MLRGVEVAALQGEAGERAQVVDGEVVLAEPEPLGVGIGAPGRIDGLSQVTGLEPGQCLPTRHHHQLDRFGDQGRRQSRRRLARDRPEVLVALPPEQ
jgi:hypothetical protein